MFLAFPHLYVKHKDVAVVDRSVGSTSHAEPYLALEQ